MKVAAHKEDKAAVLMVKMVADSGYVAKELLGKLTTEMGNTELTADSAATKPFTAPYPTQ